MEIQYEILAGILAFAAAMMKAVPRLVDFVQSRSSGQVIKDLAWLYAELSRIRHQSGAVSVSLCKTVNGGGRPQLGHQISSMTCYRSEASGQIRECFAKTLINQQMATVIAKAIASQTVPVSTGLLCVESGRKYKERGIAFLLLVHVTLTPESFYYLCFEFPERLPDGEIQLDIVKTAKAIGNKISS